MDAETELNSDAVIEVGAGVSAIAAALGAARHRWLDASPAPGLNAAYSCADYTTMSMDYNSGFALGCRLTRANHASNELAGIPVVA